MLELFRENLHSTDKKVQNKLMFGSESEGIPWCAGYAVGRLIVTDYAAKNPGLTQHDLLKTSPADILKGSRFAD